MFHFSEVTSNNEIKEVNKLETLSNTDRKSMKEKVNEFWDNVFSDKNCADEVSMSNYMNEIFVCTEDQFTFDFVLDDKLQKIIEPFKEAWEEIDISEKKKCIMELSDAISERLGLSDKPSVEYFFDEPSNCGYYSPYSNFIAINENTLQDAKEILDTIPHEIRHAYQHMRAGLRENHTDILYKINLDNYIMPVFLEDGSCICFMDYLRQYVEAEARAFANLFSGERMTS